MRRIEVILILVTVLGACSRPQVTGVTTTGPPSVTSQATVPTTTTAGSSASAATTNPVATTILPADLTGESAWFAPLPPMPTGPGR